MTKPKIDTGHVTTRERAQLPGIDHRSRLEKAVAAALTDRTDAELEVSLWLPAVGESRHCTAAVVAMEGPEGTAGAVVWLHDITESTHMREELLRRATHDPLTGCLNRAAVLEALTHALARQGDEYTAVFYIDLNRFKHVNDTLGPL